MFRSVFQVAFIYFALYASALERVTEVVTYVSQIASNLQNESTAAVFTCWLVQFTDNSTFTAVRGELAHRLSAHYISLLQSDHQEAHDSILQDPNMAVLLLGRKHIKLDDYIIHRWVAKIPVDCKTFVLFEHETERKLFQLGDYLAEMGVWNVVLIAMNEDAMFTFHFKPLRVSNYTGFPSAEVLFYDRLQTIQARYLSAGFTRNIYTQTLCEQIAGEDIFLFKIFAKTLNMTLLLDELNCFQNNSVYSCNSTLDSLDFMIDRYFFLRYNKFAVSCAMMEQIGIITPKGRPLSIWEILLKPFQQSVWWMIISIFVGYHLIEYIVPTLFTNNLVCLALFGFEKRQLRRTQYGEKAVSIALILIFFLLQCAYEAKIISYIIGTPRFPGATTIQALRDQNITVYYKNFDTAQMDKLDGLLAKYDKNEILFDGVTILDNRIVLNIEKHMNEVAGGKLMPYFILTENVFEMLPFYTFQPKSPYAPAFRLYQQRAFEAGLPFQWRQVDFRCLRFYRNTVLVNGLGKQSDDTIRKDKLQPLVLFFVLQWFIEVVVFAVEVLVGCFTKLGSR
uniref:Ionotropic glutamate receptor C-terminal domain-containing protein n=1 Tax=Anopheles dirus TaxID=7168 RepID=A0A1Y9H1W5_9DIPT